MTETSTQDFDKAFDKLAKLLAEHEIETFTAEEAQALKEVAKVWRAIRGVVWLLGGSAQALKVAMVIVAGWAAFKMGFFEWVRDGLAQKN